MVPSPLIFNKIVKKRQMQSIWFFASVTKILLYIFWNNFRNFISSRGLSHDHYWRDGIQEIKNFCENLGEFLIFLCEIFFDSNIISTYCDKYQKNIRCSTYPGSEAQSPDFEHFLTNLGFLKLFVLAEAFSLGHWSFLRKIRSMYTLSRVVKDFFMISSSEPIISTMQIRFS